MKWLLIEGVDSNDSRIVTFSICWYIKFPTAYCLVINTLAVCCFVSNTIVWMVALAASYCCLALVYLYLILISIQLAALSAKLVQLSFDLKCFVYAYTRLGDSVLILSFSGVMFWGFFPLGKLWKLMYVGPASVCFKVHLKCNYIVLITFKMQKNKIK